MGDVVTQQLEALVVEEVLDVATGAGEEVVDAKHLVAALEQAVGEMRPEEAGAAGDENSALEMHRWQRSGNARQVNLRSAVRTAVLANSFSCCGMSGGQGLEGAAKRLPALSSLEVTMANVPAIIAAPTAKGIISLGKFGSSPGERRITWLGGRSATV